MELIQGGDLKSILSTKSRLSEKIVKFYAVQMIDAIMYLHDKKIVHRDMKLENILVN